MASKIDIIVPVFNCEPFLHQCIKSLKSQEVNYRILIADDGSTDNSVKIVETFKDESISSHENKVNKGNLKTINYLLEQTEAPYIAFQDADDWSAKERLRDQLKFMESGNLDFCFTNYTKTSADGSKQLYNGFYPNLEINLNTVQELESNICFASILMKRTVYETIGGFDSYFDGIGAADIDWLYRAVLAGFKGQILNTTLYFYRNNPQSYTSTVSLDQRKSISVALARFLFEFRKSSKQLNSYPSKKNLNRFIRHTLKINKFDRTENIRKYAVQLIHNKQMLKALYYLMLLMLRSPFNIKNIQTINYLRYKFSSNA